jgi:hypothetical protein
VQRKSSFRDALAPREIVDNAFEAGAENVWIVFNRPKESERDKPMRRDSVSAIAFIDDGCGMLPQMARYCAFPFPHTLPTLKGRHLTVPDRFPPDREAMAWRREVVFRS